MFDKVVNFLSPKTNADQNVVMNLSADNPLREYVPDHTITLHSKPYRYAIIDDFFTEDFHQALTKQYREHLERGLTEDGKDGRFSRFGGYDAYSTSPLTKRNLPTDVLRTPEWIQYFRDLFGVDVNNDEITAFHHHETGSASGWMHSDYIISSFKDDPLPNGVNAWNFQCKYEDSDGTNQPGTHQVMRAITILYYLNNECNGEFGGETAIFEDERIVDRAHPKNNRLLVFEVSPKSNHAFVSNRKYPRNSIIQWLHQDIESAKARCNNEEPLRW